jgi:DNA anti-recombination protein RmuC
MKNARNTMIVALFSAALLILAGCGGGNDNELEQVQQDLDEAVHTAADWSQQQWDNFVSTTRDSFNALKEDWSDAQEQLAESGNEGMEALKERFQRGMDGLQSKIAEMERASADEREQLKRAVDETLNNLKELLVDIREQMDGN